MYEDGELDYDFADDYCDGDCGDCHEYDWCPFAEDGEYA